jgi:hypothetical protein
MCAAVASSPRVPRCSVALLAGCLGPFAVVRAPSGSRKDLTDEQKLRVRREITRTYGESVPVVYLNRAPNGYLFDAPAEIAADVGLVMEDLSSRRVVWHEVDLEEAPREAA